MRVALDVTPALSGLTGVARYTRQLAESLAVIGVDVRPFAVGRGPGDLPTGTRHLRVPLRVVQPVWSHLRVPRAEWLSAGADLTHSLDLLPPPTRLPLVVTVHDLAALDRPDLHAPHAAAQLTRRLETLDRAAVVIAISATTGDALARHGISASRIMVSLLAPVPLLAAPVTPPETTPFVLAVGELMPRKDYPTLLQALALEPAREVRLVVAGPVGFRGEEVIALATRLGLDDRVRFAGHVTDGELAGLYQGATALCLPSVIEGFGLPLVEAMSAGLPIIASDIPVVREITSDAALLVPVCDPDRLAAALAQVLSDADLRAKLRARGVERAKDFSWERTARATLEGYERALSCG